MKHTARKWKTLFSFFICLALMAVSLPVVTKAEEELPVGGPLYIMGTVHREGSRILLTDIHGGAAMDELVLNISDETRILSAVDGFPVSADALKDGETVFAYISQAMTLSLPPQSHATAVICQIPVDFTAPRYEIIKSFTQNSDGTYQLSTVHNNLYTVSSSTVLLPYLTRNIVTVSDLEVGRTCLVWGTSTPTVPGAAVDTAKIVLFPDGAGEAGNDVSSGPAADSALPLIKLR